MLYVKIICKYLLGSSSVETLNMRAHRSGFFSQTDYDWEIVKIFTTRKDAEKAFEKYAGLVSKLRYEPYHRLYIGKAYMLQEEVYYIDEDDEDAEEELIEDCTLQCACSELSENDEDED